MAGWWASVLIEGEMKMTYLVYVQPGSIYLVIGAKTPSVRNIIVISLLPEKFPYGRLRLFRLGKKFQGFISRGRPIDRLIVGIF